MEQRLIRFFCGLLGVTRGRFLSMISSAANPRWPLRPPSWIWFPSIRGQTPESTGPIFWWLIGGDWRKVPFDDHPPLIQDGRYRRHLGFGFHWFWPTPVSTCAIFWCLTWGDWRKVPFDDQRRRSSNMAATAAILDLVSVDYLTNACVDWSDFLWLIGNHQSSPYSTSP
jgi:hypothetical protein